MTMQPRTWSSSATSASRTTLWNHWGKSSARVGEIPAFLPCANAPCILSHLMAETRLSFRRRFGLDRSGPAPTETRPGAPLRPWTIPNAIGYLRLAGIPVFLYLSFSSGDGHDLWAAGLFWLIAAGDYLDGFVARATGQYSRMGALLDPVVDRLTILSGAAVVWHFELLPRWALALLAARELVTLILGQIAL